MNKLPVFYNSRQSAKLTDQDQQGISPSASKPELVLESWQRLPIEVMDFQPLTIEHLSLAHAKTYVRGVMSLETLNGFYNASPQIAVTLPWTSGSMAAAAEYAARTGNTAASLTSGFHHAGYHSGGGFCTFNGLMIAAVMLLNQGYKKIGILDLDMHYGDGTDDIIRQLKLKKQMVHYTFGREGVIKGNAEAWLKKLPSVLKSFRGCDVILFQGGVDPHVDDPLGGVLTTDQMRRRDAIVFENAKKLQIPVAFGLAGGYQKPISKVLDLHLATAEECIRVNYASR